MHCISKWVHVRQHTILDRLWEHHRCVHNSAFSDQAELFRRPHKQVYKHHSNTYCIRVYKYECRISKSIIYSQIELTDMYIVKVSISMDIGYRKIRRIKKKLFLVELKKKSFKYLQMCKKNYYVSFTYNCDLYTNCSVRMSNNCNLNCLLFQDLLHNLVFT